MPNKRKDKVPMKSAVCRSCTRPFLAKKRHGVWKEFCRSLCPRLTYLRNRRAQRYAEQQQQHGQS